MPDENDADLMQHFKVEREYFDLIKDACKNDHAYDIPNGSLEHAKVLIYFLIGKAEKNIKILSSKFDKKCYEDKKIIEVLKQKIEKGVAVSCIYRDERGLPKLIEKETKPVKIDPDAGEIIKNDFLVVDEKCYRLEEPHGKNIEDIEATVNFNDRSFSRDLNNLFEDIFQISKSKTNSK